MILSPANIKKTINYCKKNGIKNAAYAVAERVLQAKQNKYSYIPPTDEELEILKAEELEKQENAPKFSIIVPAYETKPIYIEDLVLSVEDQIYLNYELIIADASESNSVEKMVKGLQEQYDNIVYRRLESNEGISGNSNKALEFVSGDYVGLLDHDDLMTPDTLFYVAKEIIKAKEKELILVYTDEDKTDTYLEKYYEPNIKTEINKNMILTNNYVCHMSFYKADVIKQLGFRAEYDGAQDYDLVLRTIKYVYDKWGEDELKSRIKHVPKILYHWRCHNASTAENPESKMYAYEAGKNAVQDFLDSLGIKGKVEHIKHLGFYRVNYDKGILNSSDKVGAVGGPIYKNNKIVGGAMNGKEELLYGGLNINFSGYLNRAKLQQNVEIVDVRNIEIKDEYKDLFKEVVGFDYPINLKEINQEKYSDEFFYKKSHIFCNKLKALSIDIIYEPEMKMFL